MAALFSRNVTDIADNHIVSLRGELDMETAGGLIGWLTEVSGSRLVVDLSELSFMDSGLAVMVQAKNKWGDSFVLTRPQPNVRRVFEVTGLGHWIVEWDSAWSAEN